VGLVGTTTHWTGPEFGQMAAAFGRGDVAAARAINARLQASFRYVNSDDCVFPMAIKAMLRTLGVEAGECRLQDYHFAHGQDERHHDEERGEADKNGDRHAALQAHGHDALPGAGGARRRGAPLGV
jgi:dihydrodipicolinate synthase/N-acetylneuraminate lyase